LPPPQAYPGEELALCKDEDEGGDTYFCVLGDGRC
jgi:hypothetical protein